MKRKIDIVCWILFTICSSICFFINFMSNPPVDDIHALTFYMTGAWCVFLFSVFVIFSSIFSCPSCNLLFLYFPKHLYSLLPADHDINYHRRTKYSSYGADTKFCRRKYRSGNQIAEKTEYRTT